MQHGATEKKTPEGGRAVSSWPGQNLGEAATAGRSRLLQELLAGAGERFACGGSVAGRAGDANLESSLPFTSAVDGNRDQDHEPFDHLLPEGGDVEQE